MAIPSCSTSVWKNLYEVADEFRQIACWEWMSDSDVFGVHNPESGEIGYCCVLGELGEVYGLVVYLGSSGLEQHRKIQSGKLHAGSPDFAYSQCCLTAWFGTRRDLDTADLKVVKELGLKFQASDAWPQFRSMQPGYLPWYLAETEAKFLTLCLAQARQVALRFSKDPDWLTAPGKNLYLVQVPSVKTDSHPVARSTDAIEPAGQQTLFPELIDTLVYQWDSEWLRPAPFAKAAVRPFPLDEVRLQRIKKNSREYGGTWEIDTFFVASPVGGDNRPFFPYTFLCAERGSGLIMGTVLAEQKTWELEFPKSFLASVEQHKILPRKLSLRKEDLGQLFAPLATQLEIEIEMTKKLPDVDRAKRGLLKFMEKQL